MIKLITDFDAIIQGKLCNHHFAQSDVAGNDFTDDFTNFMIKYFFEKKKNYKPEQKQRKKNNQDIFLLFLPLICVCVFRPSNLSCISFSFIYLCIFIQFN